MSQPSHPHHLVAPSPWPAMGAAGALLLALGALLTMNPLMLGDGLGAGLAALDLLLTLPGLALIGTALYGWWMDVVREGSHEGRHAPPIQLALRTGMTLFIAAEAMFFATFFWAFFYASLHPTAAIGFVWPPAGIETSDPLALPWFNTLILLTSALAVSWARHDLEAGRTNPSALKLAAAIVLGALFVFILAFDLNRAAFSIADGIYATNFFVIAGVLGFHAVVGVGFLTVSWLRLARGHFGPDRHFAFVAAGRFWRFVVAVWLLVYACIYWWGSV